MTVQKFSRIALASLAMAVSPLVAHAQIFTPTFMAPRPGNSVGVYLSDFDRGDFAVEGILRRNLGQFELGLRGGIVDAGGTDITLGAEYRNPVSLGTAPVDLAFTGGVQALIGDADWLGAQAGLTIGHTLVPGSFSITPYLHPRVALIDYPFLDGAELEVLAELGADIQLAGGVAIRFAVGLDDVAPDWGIGISWR